MEKKGASSKVPETDSIRCLIRCRCFPIRVIVFFTSSTVTEKSQCALHRTPVLVKNPAGRLTDPIALFRIADQTENDVGHMAGIEDPKGTAGIFELTAYPTKILGMRPEEDRFGFRCGLQRVVATGLDQTAPNEGDIGQDVKLTQDTDAIDHQHWR